jgi:Protein of unknown function (DUF4238)
MQSLAPEASVNHVEDQHVISKVILRRFAELNGRNKGLLYPFRLRYPCANRKLLGPDGCGKIKDFLTYSSASAEHLWKETEDRLPEALNALEDGTLLSKREYVATIKNAIALHFARSVATRTVTNRVSAAVTSATRNFWLTQRRRELESAFLRTKGFYAVGDQALNFFLDEMMEPTLSIVRSDQWFRARVEDLFYKARELVDGAGIEVLTSGDKEFLIGDIPALTIPRDNSRPGVLGGTAFGEARTVLMPLGPRHVVALAQSNATAELNDDQVDEVNNHQIRGALEYVYFRPASNLAQYVRSFVTSACHDCDPSISSLSGCRSCRARGGYKTSDLRFLLTRLHLSPSVYPVLPGRVRAD